MCVDCGVTGPFEGQGRGGETGPPIQHYYYYWLSYIIYSSHVSSHTRMLPRSKEHNKKQFVLTVLLGYKNVNFSRHNPMNESKSSIFHNQRSKAYSRDPMIGITL